MAIVDVVGTVAAVCTTLSFVPQVIQIWRTRTAKSVSMPMYVIFTAGVLLWLAYGLMLGSWPIIACNAVTLVLAVSVIVMKVKFDATK